MAFTVDLYSINVRSDAANKLAGAVRQQSITTDLPRVITSNGCTVQYDQFINCNYARYEFNGLTWVCDVEIETVGNSIVNYILTVDPLSTAYYNGCFNSQQYMMRAPGEATASGLIADPLVSVSPMAEIYSGTLGNIAPYNFSVVLNAVNYDYSNRYPINSYIMSSPNYNAFLTELLGIESEVDRLSLLQSILSCYYVPNSLIPSFSKSTQAAITLPYISSEWFKPETRLKSYTFSQLAYNRTFEDTGSSSDYVTFDVNTNISLDEYSYTNAVLIIDFPNVGTTTIPLFQYGFSTITNVGVAYAFDSISGSQTIYPIINGDIFYELSQSNNIGTNFPVICDTSITNWTQTAINTAVSAVTGGITSIATANPVPIALAVLGNIAATASTYNQEALSSTALKGGYGFNVDYSFNKQPTYKVIAKQPIFEQDVHSRFGYLKLAYDNLSGYSGYIQTSNCALPHNGLPRSVIDSANSLLDAGVWIL